MATRPTYNVSEHEIEERAVQIAIVILTRRSDVRVRKSTGPDNGTDLLVTIEAQAGTQAVFGVQIKATLSAEVPRSRLQRMLAAGGIAQASTFPVCQLLVDVVSEHVQWRWLLEPVRQNDRATLRDVSDNMSIQTFDNAAVDAIIGQVQHWQNSQQTWQARQVNGKWMVENNAGQQIADVNDQREAELIAAAPDMRAVLSDALPVLRSFSDTDEKATRVMKWTLQALAEAVGDSEDVVNAAPSLANALRSAMKYISAAALTDKAHAALQSRARNALRAVLG